LESFGCFFLRENERKEEKETNQKAVQVVTRPQFATLAMTTSTTTAEEEVPVTFADANLWVSIAFLLL
jgi:hypothetical protein